MITIHAFSYFCIRAFILTNHHRNGAPSRKGGTTYYIMKVVMLQDVDKVGFKHDLVTVKDGFGRNYLIPNGLAIIANKSNLGRLAEMTRREDAQEQKRLDEYKAIAKQVDGKTLEIVAKAGTSGKIFGSITLLMIHTSIQSQFGVDIPRKKIVMPDNVKTLGEYPLVLNLHKDVTANLTMALTDQAGKAAPTAAAETTEVAETDEATEA